MNSRSDRSCGHYGSLNTLQQAPHTPLEGQSSNGCFALVSILCAVLLSCSVPEDANYPDPPPSCPDYTHRNVVRTGNAEDLPEGFIVFDRDTIPGLFKSPLQKFKSSLIPNTNHNFPRSISISDDGQWIFFVDSRSNTPYIIRSNGCRKTEVPAIGVAQRNYCPGGFYRNSPYGTELFYLAGKQSIRAIKVTFTADGPLFGTDRTIAALSSLYLNAVYTIQYAVSRDQIFGEIGPVHDATIISRTGFLTIPGNGTGIASDTDIYKWADDDYRLIEGCGHTMSFDGQFVAANAGPQLHTPSECVPTGHKGFYVAPFRRSNDPPIDLYSEHLLKSAYSLNWCPERYRSSDQDFWGWYFTNSNRYIAGRMISLRENSCGWMVDWRNSVWTRVCPADSNIRIQQMAAYIGTVDTGSSYLDITCQGNDTIDHPDGDSADPVYKVIYPNGGELFHFNEPCTVQVTSARPGNAVLYLCLHDGLNNVPLTTDHSFNPQIDSLFTFTIRDTFTIYGRKVASVSDECFIKIQDYDYPTWYYDESDDYFGIVP